MKHEDILRLYKDSRDSFVQKIKVYNRDFYNEVNSKFVGRNFSEKLYQYIYGKFECETCGSDVKFISFGEGYRKYCCRKCSNEDTKDIRRSKIKKDLSKWETKICPECNNRFDVLKIRKQVYCSNKCSAVATGRNDTRIKKIKKTKFERYGDENYVNSEKAKQTNLERYGVENPASLSETKNKIKETNLNRYGVECSFESEKVKEKIKQTNLERYGVENVLLSPEIKEKIKETNLNRHGVENVFSSELIKEKIKETNLERYGTEYAIQSDEIKSKVIENQRHTNYKNIVDRLNNRCLNIVPLFTLEEYESTFRDNKYEFLCKKCGSTFMDHIDGGHLPRCLKCDPIISGFSNKEREVLEYIRSIYKGEIIENCRKLLKGKEIDIYIPELNLAFEFNGIYWHSELGGNKNKSYHLNKTNECENLGIRLIHIFEDEWRNKQDIVKSKLRYLIGLKSESVYARKCFIEEISSETCNEFLKSNHIQGKCVSKIKIGLFRKFDRKLVSVITFGRLRKSLGNKSVDGHYELIRYCSDINYNVVGGMSKLLSYFIKNYNPNVIITYADRRYSSRHKNVYKNVGFEYIGESTPNYWYFYRGEFDRHHRYKFAKHRLSEKLEKFDNNLSEWQNMQMNGYDRIWDCGSLKYQMVL